MQINRRQPIVTYVLIGANALMFAVEFFTGALNNTQMLVLLGAKYSPLIALGDWWRLVSAMFLHGGVEHLLMNMLSLFLWGRYIEAMFGKVRYIALYFLAGILGSALSFALSPNVAVGASGAIFGLFGAMLVLWVHDRRMFNNVFGTQVLILIAVNLGMTFLRPGGIDVWGHVGGIVGGFLAAMAIGFYRQKSFTIRRGLATAGYILLLGGMCLLGFVRFFPQMLS